MSNKTFEIIRDFNECYIPALITFVTAVMAAIGVNAEVAAVIIAIMAAANTCLGTIIRRLRNKYIEDVSSGLEEGEVIE